MAQKAAILPKLPLFDGKEKIRSQYDVYGSFEKDLTFQLPDSPIFTVKLLESKMCEGTVPDSQDGQFTPPKTELLGVEISSKNGLQTFKLAQPETVSCAAVDDSFVNHHPQDISTTAYGISFHLPNGQQAWISTSDGPEKMDISFY